MTEKTNQPARPEASQPSSGPARAMANQLSVYYANCAMIATSPRDISLFFGRFVPTADEKGGQKLMELYERQVYMTLEQAEDLAAVLNQTVKAFKARKEQASS
jgi:hypothetical protein